MSGFGGFCVADLLHDLLDHGHSVPGLCDGVNTEVLVIIIVIMIVIVVTIK